jgi:hypothetical protein
MNRSDIEAAVRDYLHRTDASTTAQVPQFVAFAEAMLRRSFFPPSQEHFAQLTVVNGAAPLPADFGTALAVIAPGQGELAFMPAREFLGDQAAHAGSTALVYTIAVPTATGARSIVVGSGATQLTLLYIPKAEATELSGATESYLTVDYPDVLTWAAIAEGFRFLQSWDDAATALGHMSQLADAATTSETRANASGGRLVIRSN